MLNRHPEIQAHAVVLLGAPVRGCLAGRRLGRAAGSMDDGRLPRAVGRASGALDAARAARGGRRHARRWASAAPSAALPGPNDGVVCVEETTVEGMTAARWCRQGHSMLIFSGRVCELVERFSRSGRFA